MDLKKIKELLDLIAESGVNEVTIEEQDFKIKVKKAADPAAIQYEVQRAPVQAVQEPYGASSTAAAFPANDAPAGNPTAASVPAPADEGEPVKSPLVGTFYEAPSPDADPFVRVGDTVKTGDTLCIVEAMKIMNEIKAEFDGTVVKVSASNGQAVEFDQPLFLIKKN